MIILVVRKIPQRYVYIFRILLYIFLQFSSFPNLTLLLFFSYLNQIIIPSILLLYLINHL